MRDMTIEVATAISFLRIAERSWYPFYRPFSNDIAKSVADFLQESLERARKEAVPGGASCHSAEHAVPETASKGEQRD